MNNYTQVKSDMESGIVIFRVLLDQNLMLLKVLKHAQSDRIATSLEVLQEQYSTSLGFSILEEKFGVYLVLIIRFNHI